MIPEAPPIVAKVISDDVQFPPLVVDENVVFCPAQIVCVPLNVPAIGAAVTVTVLVAVTFAQPPVPKTV